MEYIVFSLGYYIAAWKYPDGRFYPDDKQKDPSPLEIDRVCP